MTSLSLSLSLSLAYLLANLGKFEDVGCQCVCADYFEQIRYILAVGVALLFWLLTCTINWLLYKMAPLALAIVVRARKYGHCAVIGSCATLGLDHLAHSGAFAMSANK